MVLKYGIKGIIMWSYSGCILIVPWKKYILWRYWCSLGCACNIFGIGLGFSFMPPLNIRSI